MNKKYIGQTCPICKNKIKESDDIAVCPECGAPYHRECIRQTGSCILTELHEKGEQWQPEKEDPPVFGDGANICPRCGVQNDTHSRYCNICGAMLEPTESDAFARQDNPASPFAGLNGQNRNMPNGIPYNPYVNPFGGFQPDTKLDDVSVKEIAAFTGNNSHYFISRFTMIKMKGIALNFAAFFFHGLYFIYRKMYTLGILLALLYVIFSIPSAVIAYNMVMQSMFDPSFSVMGISSGNMMTIDSLCSLVRLAIMTFSGFAANRLYMSHSFSKIKNTRKKYPDYNSNSVLHKDQSEYYKELSNAGGVNFILPIVLAGVYFILQFTVYAVLMITL